MKAIILVVRHPDYGNEYTIDGDARVLDIDLGSSFDGTPDGADQAEEWVENLDGWLDWVPVTSSVFTRAIDVIRNAVDRYPSAVAHVDQYVTDRLLAAATDGEGS